MRLGRKIYYDRLTGEMIQDTGDRVGDISPTTTEQDFQIYTALAERVPESVGCIELEPGQYAEDFGSMNGVTVDVTDPAAPKLLFTYPDPAQPEDPPVYQKPLSEEVTAIKTENAALRQQMAQQNADFTAFQDFYFEKNPEQA